MNLSAPDILLQPQKAAHRQIADTLREKILANAILPGTLLPSTQALAQSWQTHVATVHLALTQLAREGLLERTRKGTRVRQIANRLAVVGVYSGSDRWLPAVKEAEFCRHVYRHFADILGENQVTERVFVDHRPTAEQLTPLPALAKAVNEHEIQALLVLSANHEQAQWVLRQPIPMTGLSRTVPGAVSHDLMQFIDIGIGRLAADGCRSAAVIASLGKEYAEFAGRLTAAAKRHGLELRDEWVQVPTEWVRDHERYGYEQFRALWALPNHPQGLLVYPDNMARGVITAILQERISIPEQLQLVLHRNTGIDYVCPFPATFLESSCREIAQQQWEQLRRQVRGEPATAVYLNFLEVQNERLPQAKKAAVA